MPADDVASALAAFEARPVGPTIAKMRYSHDAMIDHLVADPSISQNELAAIFGYSASWISIIVNTDMFQAKLAARRDEMVNPLVAATLKNRFEAVAQRSLEVLQEKLAQPADKVPDLLAIRAAEMGAKALGMGNPQLAPGTKVDVNVRLEGLAERLTGLLSAKRMEIIDV